MMPFQVSMTFEQIPGKEQKMRTIVDRSIAYAADQITIKSKELCPVKTGRLQGSIRQGTLTDGRWVGPDTPYDIYVEFGTGRMKSQPYMRPALDKTARIIGAFMARRYREIMR